MIPIIIPLIVFVLWYSYSWLSRDEILVKDAPLLVVYGRVDSVYKDSDNHNFKYYYLSNGHRYFIWQESPEAEVSAGDSISKSKGSTKVYVFQKGGREMVVDYNKFMLELVK